MSWKITGAPGTGDDLLYSQAGTPTLDLRFASSKSLNDYVSGQNLIDFTRGGNGIGTYVGSDGLIKNSVVNLLLRSEEFDNSAWTKISGLTVVADATLAPDGLHKADKLVAGTTTSFKRVFNAPAGPTGTYTGSCYVKAAGYNFAYVGVYDGNTDYNTVFVDLTDGSFTQFGGAVVPYSIHPVGNGWYRISATTANTSNNAFTVGIASTANPSTIGGTQNFSGDGSSGIYVWGAQLEQASTVGEYVKTTSSISGAPRFDHDPETGESLGLLIEEQRTNLLLRSEELDNAAWTPFATGTGSNPVVTANYAIAPNGLLQADRLQADRGAGNSVSDSSVLQNNITPLTNPHTVTLSVWMKSNTGANQEVYFRNVTGAGGSLATVTPEWQRFSVTSENVALLYDVFQIGTRGTINTDNAIDILVWGAQVEVGAFPTSYIPTTTAQVTRADDLASITGTNFSSWYNQDEGTVFCDAKPDKVVSDFTRPWDFTYPWPAQTWLKTDGVVFACAASPATNNPALGLGIPSKTIVGYNAITKQVSGSAFGIMSNIATGATDARNVSTMYIGRERNGDNYLNSTISRITYFGRRLPNATLQTITA